jgi:predicted transcriptional regulator
MRQVAIQIDAKVVVELDRLAGEGHRSRAEVVRLAVGEWLARQREAATDAALARGYDDLPPGGDERAWADVSVDGLRAADLDW